MTRPEQSQSAGPVPPQTYGLREAGGLAGVLDGFGALHAFGQAAPVAVSAYWPSWSIARDVVLTPGSTASQAQGYVLEGFGGLHAFGGAADARVTGAIKGKLVANKDLSALSISVNTTEGIVTLSGSVNSAEDISKAMLLAMETDGVHEVISTLQVKPKQAKAEAK